MGQRRIYLLYFHAAGVTPALTGMVFAVFQLASGQLVDRMSIRAGLAALGAWAGVGLAVVGAAAWAGVRLRARPAAPTARAL